MQSDAQTFVVVAHVYHAHRVGGPFGQAFQVEASGGIFLGGEFRGNRQMTGDDFVDRILNAGDVFVRGSLWKREIKFAFLPFDVG